MSRHTESTPSRLPGFAADCFMQRLVLLLLVSVSGGAEVDEHGAIDISDAEPATVASDVIAEANPDPTDPETLDEQENAVLGFANAGAVMHFGEEDFDEFCPFGLWLSLVYAPRGHSRNGHAAGGHSLLLQMRIGCTVVQTSGTDHGRAC